MKTISVLLADDHNLVRQGCRALLCLAKDIEVVGEARNGREAVLMTKQHRPDVVLMDLSMPLLNGLVATQQILAELPTTNVIILSGYSDDASVDRLIGIGAAGYLFKHSSAEMLTQAIREVHRGNRFFSPSIMRRLENQDKESVTADGGRSNRGLGLTPRETEVVQLIAESHANKQIAADLGISVKTVQKHRQHLMNKLHIHDTAGLTRYAIAQGIIIANSGRTAVI